MECFVCGRPVKEGVREAEKWNREQENCFKWFLSISIIFWQFLLRLSAFIYYCHLLKIWPILKQDGLGREEVIRSGKENLEGRVEEIERRKRTIRNMSSGRNGGFPEKMTKEEIWAGGKCWGFSNRTLLI